MVSNFLSPPNEDEEESTVFLLDEVVRQQDEGFLGGTYEGGCEYLLKWFRDRVGPHGAICNNE